MFAHYYFDCLVDDRPDKMSFEKKSSLLDRPLPHGPFSAAGPVRDHGADIAKAMAIVLVFLWHVKPVRDFCVLTNLFYCDITLIAVPLFYLVSIYLFIQKSVQKKWYGVRRTGRVLRMYIAWTALQYVAFIVVTLSGLFPHFPRDFSFVFNFRALRMGGPVLPGVGDPVFYFLFNLAAFFLITQALLWLPRFLQVIVSIAVVFFTAGVFFFPHTEFGYWDIRNFLVYIPCALLFAQKKGAKNLWWIAGILYVTAIIFQRTGLLPQVGGIYSRPSIIFGAVAVFSCALSVNFGKEPGLVKWLSENSLWIFGLHKYCQLASIVLWSFLSHKSIGFSEFFIARIPIDPGNLFVFFLTASLTFAATTALPRARFLKKALY